MDSKQIKSGILGIVSGHRQWPSGIWRRDDSGSFYAEKSAD